ncbi:MAG: AIR synthase-related protein, partial [Kiritimatiellia bacterium]
GADSTEINPDCSDPVIDILPDQKKIEGLGGNMRLGGQDIDLAPGTLAHELFEKAQRIRMRFRHRYEVDPRYVFTLEKAGMVFSGKHPTQPIMQIMELPRGVHPYFIGTQAHPCLTSRPLHPQPMFVGLVAAALRLGKPAVKRGKAVGRLDMKFLYDGCPTLKLAAEWKPPAPRERKRGAGRAKDLAPMLSRMLGDLNLCSKEFKSRQYDGEVKGLSVVKPFIGVKCDMPADATVMRVEYKSNEGIALAEGINPFYSDIDAYHMAASVIDEGVRRAVSAGARLGRIAGLDNFCWPDPVLSEKTPDGLHKLAQLVRACKALYDLTTAYSVPCISGKDSCKNDSTRGGRKISIPPTLLFSTIAKIDDVRSVITPDFKRAGDLIYAIGMTRNELGASAFNRATGLGAGEGYVPQVFPAQALRTYRAMNRAAKLGMLRSSHTPCRGGLAVGLAMCAMGGGLGADLSLAPAPREPGLGDRELLFSESNSRFIVTVAPAQAGKLEKIFKGVPHARIGRVSASGKLVIRGTGNETIIAAGLEDMRKSFKKTLYGV